MKGFALVLLCALVAVQARNTGVVKTVEDTRAALGENPYVVHLRIAVSTSGLLNSCSGTLIDQRFVLTAGSCLENARFIWIRYGVVNVVNPELVTESSSVQFSPDRKVGIININRNVQSTDNIRPVSLARSDNVSEGKKCGFGQDESGNAGDRLSCRTLEAGVARDGEFEDGAGLVRNEYQVGLVSGGELISLVDNADWIEQQTGVPVADIETPESFLVNFVN